MHLTFTQWTTLWLVGGSLSAVVGWAFFQLCKPARLREWCPTPRAIATWVACSVTGPFIPAFGVIAAVFIGIGEVCEYVETHWAIFTRIKVWFVRPICKTS